MFTDIMKEHLNEENQESVRLDCWLNAARFYKTRSQAARACNGRKVKVNGETAKSHKEIRVGDEILVFQGGRYRKLEILGLASRGLPYSEARLLYREDTPEDRLSSEDTVLVSLYNKTYKRLKPRYKGRPTKKERRKMDRERNHFFKEEGE